MIGQIVGNALFVAGWSKRFRFSAFYHFILNVQRKGFSYTAYYHLHQIPEFFPHLLQTGKCRSFPKFGCTYFSQYLSLEIDPETYRYEIANARTFTAYEDIEPLIKMGKIKGGTLDCAIVIKGDKILSNEPLRYNDEFVRHKILDIIGDLALLGNPIKGHVIAIKTGHALNADLTKTLWEQEQQEVAPELETPTEALLDIHEILKRLPHRYPFISSSALLWMRLLIQP